MYVKMLSNQVAAGMGGRTLIEYEADNVYEVSDSIGQAFVRRQWARHLTRDEIADLFGKVARAHVEQAVYEATVAQIKEPPPPSPPDAPAPAMQAVASQRRKRSVSAEDSTP